MHATSPPTSSSCTLIFAFWRDLVHICIVFINTSCQEKKPKHTDIAHGHGGVPVPAAVRLQACRPLLPSAAAAGMPQPPDKRKGHRPPQPTGLWASWPWPVVRAHASADHGLGPWPWPGRTHVQARPAEGPIKHQGPARRRLPSSLGVGPCIQDTEGRSRARAVHENKQDAGTCNCRAATRHVQGEDTAIRKGQKSSSLPNFVSVDTGNAEPESCRGRQEWGWMKAANPHFIRKCASLLHHIYR